MTSLASIRRRGKQEILLALEAAFVAGKEYHQGGWSAAELEEAKRLVSSRYGTMEWNGER